ncbi:MAG TPA: hypothetical protein VF879_00060, partial [Nitrospirales bacterium]
MIQQPSQDLAKAQVLADKRELGRVRGSGSGDERAEGDLGSGEFGGYRGWLQFAVTADCVGGVYLLWRSEDTNQGVGGILWGGWRRPRTAGARRDKPGGDHHRDPEPKITAGLT